MTSSCNSDIDFFLSTETKSAPLLADQFPHTFVSVFVFSGEIWSWFWAALKLDRAILSCLVSYSYTVRSNDVKALKSRWNFVKTKTLTPSNSIYTFLITFIALSSFISSKFQTFYLSYTWATCVITRRQKVLATGNEPFYKILRN